VRALEIIGTRQVSLVMSDQNMPGMSGTEFLQRSRLINEHMVRIVVTSNTDSKTFVDAIKTAGAIGVISKPWEPRRVERAVFDALSRYEIMTENRLAMSRLRQSKEALRQVARRR
jgi:DNA-binding NtrC family response regulator